MSEPGKYMMVIMIVALTSLMGYAANDHSDAFSYENEILAGVKLNYRMAVINQDAQSTEIIVMYLHGGSGQGEDNQSQMQTQAVDDIYNYLQSEGLHVRFFVPQAPVGSQWTDHLIPALKALLDKYTGDVDTKLYILGGSMGGYGVWNMLAAYPGLFTAAMPVACNTPQAPIEDYLKTRIYTVVGRKDFRRDIDDIQSFFSRLNTQGGDAKMDIEDDWNHRETCEWSFTPKRLNWIFAKNSSYVGEIFVDPTNTTLDQIYDLRGQRIEQPVSGYIYISDGQKFIYQAL